MEAQKRGIMSNSKSLPSDSNAHVTDILSKHYNLKALHITELIPFDRRNYLVEVVLQSSCIRSKNAGDERDQTSLQSAANDGHCTDVVIPEPDTTKHQSETQNLILKIFSKQFCTNEELPKTQQKVICSQFLREQGFQCPEVLHTNRGELISPACSDRSAMLMTKLPGQMLGLDRGLLTPPVLYELGVLLAFMHQALQDFDGEQLEPNSNTTNPWDLENMHLLSHYLHYIKDDSERKMLSGFISTFESLREKFHLLQKGVIHGDFHDLNLIVDWPSAADVSTESTSPSLTQPADQTSSLSVVPAKLQRRSVLQKYGIIDFEDMIFSYPALELSRLIADMMIGCKSVDLLEVGGHVLAGYLAVDSAVVGQFHFGLYQTALVCLVQYIVLGLYENQLLDETSEYWLEGVDESSKVLGKLENTELSEVYKIWGLVLDRYGVQNPFTQQ